jgi:hypothetical protein
VTEAYPTKGQALEHSWTMPKRPKPNCLFWENYWADEEDAATSDEYFIGAELVPHDYAIWDETQGEDSTVPLPMVLVQRAGASDKFWVHWDWLKRWVPLCSCLPPDRSWGCTCGGR